MSLVDIGSGPAVVLLHAFPLDGRMWLPQAERLAASGRRVLIPDLPGFGSAPLPDRAPSLAGVADTIADLLRGAGVDRAVVVGVSLGGYLTMALLRQHPDLVAGAVYCDTKATADGPAAVDSRERMARAVLTDPDRAGQLLEAALLPGLLGDTSRARRPEVVQRVRGWLHEAPAEAVAWYQRAMATRPDSTGTLASTPRPTLVVWGDEDALSPRSEQDVLVGAVPGSDLVVVPGAGHLAVVEDPDAVTDALQRFLADVTGPRTS